MMLVSKSAMNLADYEQRDSGLARGTGRVRRQPLRAVPLLPVFAQSAYTPYKASPDLEAAVPGPRNIRERLRRRWDTVVTNLGLDQHRAQPIFDVLANLYSSPARHYHTLEHLCSVLDALARFGATALETPALFLAAWFHDAVYDSTASDNEEQSARLAETTLRHLGAPEAVVAETSRLILLTRTHVTADDDLAGRQLLDADLAILGELPEVYATYARAIRQEYAWVGEDA
jgi:predicted metal-dependent HD superfamily phosphohydrolase